MVGKWLWVAVAFILSLMWGAVFSDPDISTIKRHTLRIVVTYSSFSELIDFPAWAVIYRADGKTADAYTAAHVIGDTMTVYGSPYARQAIIVNLPDGTQALATVEEIVQNRDLARISFKTNITDYVNIASAVSGQPVYLTSNGRIFRSVVGKNVAVMTNMGRFTDENELLLANLSLGDSGGPVMDGSGRLIGIVSAMKENTGFFARIKR